VSTEADSWEQAINEVAAMMVAAWQVAPHANAIITACAQAINEHRPVRVMFDSGAGVVITPIPPTTTKESDTIS
jgi:hypothetical protein